MFSTFLKEFEKRLHAATVADDTKPSILPAIEAGLDADKVKSEHFKATTQLKLQQLYQGTKPWAELPELVCNALEPFTKILDPLLSETHSGLLSSAVARSGGIYRLVGDSKESSRLVGNGVVPKIDTKQIADILDALEAPLTWLDDLRSKLLMLLKESSQDGERPSLLSLISDLKDKVEKCNSICESPDFGRAYDEDDRRYKTIIAAEEFYQRAYDERWEPNYFKHCDKSRVRGSRLREIRNGTISLDASIETHAIPFFESLPGHEDYKQQLEWKFAVDADYNVLNWPYPPVKDWIPLRGLGEHQAGIATSKWLKEEWSPAEQTAKDMAIWAAIQYRVNVTSYILLNTSKCLEIIVQATTQICSLSDQLCTTLKDLFYNLACEAPRSVIESDIKELQKLDSAFRVKVNLIRTYKDQWIDTRFWTGKATLHSDQKSTTNNEDSLIYGISCMDVPPNHNIRIDSRWSPERGPHPHCWLDLPYQADVDWLELPDEREMIDHGSMGWGIFADHGNEEHIGVGRRQYVRYIEFRKEASDNFVHPVAVAWIQSLEMHCIYQYQISVYVDDVSQRGFQLHVDVGADSELIGIRVGWLAYSGSCRSLWSRTERFSKKGLHTTLSGPGSMGWGEACNMPQSVQFFDEFELPPRIIGLISAIDTDKSYAIRVKSKVDKVTKDRARLQGYSWDDTKANVIGITFIGRGAPKNY